LSWETTVKDVKEYFSKYGTVSDCVIKQDPSTGRSRGFGFVLFTDAQAVEKVLSEKTHTLHGRNIDPKRAKARGGREPILKVFVGGLDPSIPEEDIRAHFEKFGKVTEVDLPFDKSKNQRRAFCFVSFDAEETVDKVCTEPKQEIVEGKKVDVKKATPKNEQYGGGYGSYNYGGGYGGPSGGRGGRGGFRGGRGRGGNYNQGNGWGNYDYNSYYGNNQGYDYNNYYNQGYGNYDYNNYYGQGWGNYNYNQGYGNYGNGNQSGGNGYGGGKSKRGGGSGASTVASSSNNSHGYHPYSR